MKAGIVFEIAGGKATILKSDGEFVTVSAAADWRKGDVVRFSQPVYTLKRFYAIAACAALLVITGLGGRSLYLTPAALVSMDINPAVELILNRFDRVVSVRAYGEEGEAIMMKNKVVYQDYAEAITALLEGDSAFAPYLDKNPSVVFTVYSKDEKREETLTESLKTVTESLAGQEGRAIAAECHSVDSQTLEDAHHYGVTAGKYLYLQKLMEADPSVDIENYTHHSIKELKEDIDSCGGSHGEKKQSGHGGSHHSHG